MPADRRGLYIHIPFCLSKCRYCSFVSSAAAPRGIVERYLEALFTELELFARPVVAEPATVYFGGGTPSFLPAPLLERLLRRVGGIFAPPPGTEVTLEANPGSVDGEKAALLLGLGVTRVSLGVQSFDDGVLSRLGRAHRAGEAFDAAAALRAAGLRNLGLDLIYGAPGQGLGTWERDLSAALALSPEHLSLYALSVDEGTPFAREAREGTLGLPDEETTVAMYRLAAEVLAAAGYEHYEISNWARPGFRSRHNGDCWRGAEYYGAGAGAHGFLVDGPPRRWGNVKGVDAYAAALSRGLAPREFEEEPPPATLAAECLMLGLRMTEGVETEGYRLRFGALPGALFPDALREGRERGWLEERGGRLRFTPDGLLFSDEVFLRLF